MTPIIFLLIILSISIPTAIAEKPDSWAQAGGPLGERWVPIYYVTEFDCSEDDTHTKGCYDPNEDVIYLIEEYQWMHASTGCSVRQHEINHANGLQHGRDMPPSCENPNDHSDTHGLYDENNFFHRDPLYIWNGYNQLPSNWKAYPW